MSKRNGTSRSMKKLIWFQLKYNCTGHTLISNINIAQLDYVHRIKSPFTFLKRLGINFNNIYFVFLAMSSRNVCPTRPAPSEPVLLRRSVA